MDIMIEMCSQVFEINEFCPATCITISNNYEHVQPTELNGKSNQN